jgi:hypothetical protein
MNLFSKKSRALYALCGVLVQDRFNYDKPEYYSRVIRNGVDLLLQAGERSALLRSGIYIYIPRGLTDVRLNLLTRVQMVNI